MRGKTLAAGAGMAERTIAQLDLERLGLAVAVDLDVGGVARLEAGDRARELVGVGDRLAADPGDDVAAPRERGALDALLARPALQPRLCRRAARRHALDPRALVDLQAEVLHELRVQRHRA